MEIDTHIDKNNVISDMKKRTEDISLAISWRELAKTYFNRSSSWLYHKMDGIDGNGGVGGFTADEAKTLKEALYDLSDRIRRCADTI